MYSLPHIENDIHAPQKPRQWRDSKTHPYLGVNIPIPLERMKDPKTGEPYKPDEISVSLLKIGSKVATKVEVWNRLISEHFAHCTYRQYSRPWSLSCPYRQGQMALNIRSWEIGTLDLTAFSHDREQWLIRPNYFVVCVGHKALIVFIALLYEWNLSRNSNFRFW